MANLYKRIGNHRCFACEKLWQSLAQLDEFKERLLEQIAACAEPSWKSLGRK